MIDEKELRTVAKNVEESFLELEEIVYATILECGGKNEPSEEMLKNARRVLRTAFGIFWFIDEHLDVLDEKTGYHDALEVMEEDPL